MSDQSYHSSKSDRIQLRTAGKQDLNFLVHLRKQTMTDYLNAVGIRLGESDELDRVKYRFDAAKIVLYDGFAVGLLKAFPEEDHWNIVQMQISPPYQGKGIGTFLVQQVMNSAALSNMPISLNVLKGNPALALYQRLGFENIGQTSIEYLLQWHPN